MLLIKPKNAVGAAPLGSHTYSTHNASTFPAMRPFHSRSVVGSAADAGGNDLGDTFPPFSTAVRPTVQGRRGEGSISGLLVSPPSYMGAGGFRNHQKNWKFVALFTEQNSCPCMNFSYPERRGTRFFHDSIRGTQ